MKMILLRGLAVGAERWATWWLAVRGSALSSGTARPPLPTVYLVKLVRDWGSISSVQLNNQYHVIHTTISNSLSQFFLTREQECLVLCWYSLRSKLARLKDRRAVQVQTKSNVHRCAGRTRTIQSHHFLSVCSNVGSSAEVVWPAGSESPAGSLAVFDYNILV